MKRTCVLLAGALAACGSAGGSGGGAAGRPDAMGAPHIETVDTARLRADTAATLAGAGTPQRTRPLVPPGYGTLRQDEVTVALRSGALLIKVTPLSESVIRLLAPDTYNRLHALAESRREEARRLAGAPDSELFLVSFFSYQPDVTYQPEDVQLSHQGRLLHPLAVLPLTPGWGRQRLQQQEQQTALYAFSTDIDLELPLLVRYGLEETDEWTRIIRRLETERAKVQARAG
ncbi:MAG: hypothetical protein HY703_04175 [Gemmatimonadetes bacterium]|nr:hypothetical protein [Gemmatimonadota bacterium]